MLYGMFPMLFTGVYISVDMMTHFKLLQFCTEIRFLTAHTDSV